MAGGAYIAIALGFAFAGGIVGAIKGCVPVLGLLAAICYRDERDELRRRCPTCGRVTKIYDAVCTRCGTELEFPERAIAPESAARMAR